VRKTSPIKRVTLILLLIVLLPALFYSAFQISSISETESLLTDLYSRQLETVLFSINQYTLDVTTSWVMSLSTALERRGSDGEILTILENLRTVDAFVVTDSAISSPGKRYHARPGESPVSEEELLSALRLDRDKFARLPGYRRSGYRKIEPVAVGDSVSGGGHVGLVFALGSDARPLLGCLVVDQPAFVNAVLARRLQDAAGNDFILAVFRGEQREPVFSTSAVPKAQIPLRKGLWLLPGYTLAIRPQGTTLEELAHGRTQKNLFFIALLDVVLIAGVIVVYRSVRREMELARLKSDFVSNVSHELRTPLALIRMYAETLEMGRLTDDGKKMEYYGTILRESERLTRLVNTILDFSAMEAGKKRFTFASVQLNDIVTDVLNTYAVHMRSKGFTPVVSLGTDLPRIHADSGTLAEAILNILDNAMKYSDAEKYIGIRTGVKEHSVFVEIEDHGIGIPPAHLHKIFDMFYRVSTGPVHDRKGTGIGLALVRHIMEAHHGNVDVKSVPGKGSTFRLLFPMEEQRA
jgi:two-component system, OmpR family, phosphate regulon sensor histidine kinase PhoR